MIRNKLIYILLLFIFSCSKGPLKTPSNASIEKIKMDVKGSKLHTKEERWARDYILAEQLKNAGKLQHSCNIYKKLAAIPDFPLTDVAFTSSLQVCNITNEELTLIIKEKETPPWLKEEFFTAISKIAKQLTLPKVEIIYLLKLVKFIEHRIDKVKEIQRIKEYAKGHSDKEIDQLVNQELYKYAPRFNKDISKQNIYSVARDFERNREFDKARELYYQSLKKYELTLNEVVNTWNRIIMTHKNQRDRKLYQQKTKEMITYLQGMYKRYKSDNTQNEIIIKKIRLARIIWTDNNAKEAYNYLKESLKDHIPNSNLRSKIYWLLGNIDLEQKNREKAINNFEKSLEYIEDDNKLKDTSLWSLGQSYLINKQFLEASRVLKELYESTDQEGSSLKAKFWYAKALLSMGQDKEAIETLEELSKNSPLTYYGVMAHKKLGNEFTPLNTEVGILDFSDLTLDWLVLLEKPAVIKNYLTHKVKSVTAGEEMLFYLPYFIKVEHYRGAIRAFYRLAQDEREEILIKALPYIYPMPYFEEVSKAENTTKVESSLTYSIMRQESAFDHKIKSFAEAYGLMQLIPETAKKYLDFHKMGFPGVELLYDPKINILLGTTLLNDLRSMFPNNYVLPAASYNAGEHRVVKWIEERTGLGPVQFIEMIPYSETRKYVKLIIRNYITYERLKAKKPFDFPKALLEGI